MSTSPMRRTATPGIFRRGGRYVVTFRDASGRQRKRSARTLAQARALKAAFKADVDRGEYRALSTVTFADYARQWAETYTGRHGIRDRTRAEYRRALGLDADGAALPGGAVEFFGTRRLATIDPPDVRRYVAHLAAPGRLAQNTLRLRIAPLKALFQSAVDDGLIRSNPAAKVRIPVPEVEPEERVKALREEELRRLLNETPDEWRLFFEFLAETGLRIGEAVALTWADLDFARRRVHVRRRLYRGALGPPKSKFGRRRVPVSKRLTRALSTRWNETQPTPDEPVFPTNAGTMLDASNVMGRILKPAARRAGLGWVGFHTFRHTCATMLFERGLNAKQVQVWLGHHSAAFTLSTYVHLLSDDLPESPFDVESEAEEPELTEALIGRVRTAVESPAEAAAA